MNFEWAEQEIKYLLFHKANILTYEKEHRLYLRIDKITAIEEYDKITRLHTDGNVYYVVEPIDEVIKLMGLK